MRRCCIHILIEKNDVRKIVTLFYLLSKIIFFQLITFISDIK